MLSFAITLLSARQKEPRYTKQRGYQYQQCCETYCRLILFRIIFPKSKRGDTASCSTGNKETWRDKSGEAAYGVEDVKTQ